MVKNTGSREAGVVAATSSSYGESGRECPSCGGSRSRKQLLPGIVVGDHSCILRNDDLLQGEYNDR